MIAHEPQDSCIDGSALKLDHVENPCRATAITVVHDAQGRVIAVGDRLYLHLGQLTA